MTFTQVVYEGDFHSGGCSDWKGFGLDLSTSKSKDRIAVSVMMFGITGLNNPVLSATCANATASNIIQDQMASLLNTFLSPSLEVGCDGHLWKMHRCNGTGYASICVDCQDPCLSKHPEMPIAVALNPCGYIEYRSRHDTQMRLLLFQVHDTNFAANITQVTASVSKTTVVVKVVVSFENYVYCKVFDEGFLPSVMDVLVNSIKVSVSI